MSLMHLLNRFKGRKNSLSTNQPADNPEAGAEGVPDFVEPLLGWRAWRIRVPTSPSSSCPGFSSIILDTPWTPRRRFSAEHSFDLGARCRGLLDPGCSCGIYAFKEPLDAFVYLMRVRHRLLGMSVEVAIGTVSLWGKVIECELGYKAQFAYPQHVYLPASIVRFLAKVKLEFGVTTGIFLASCEEEINLPLSLGMAGQHRSMVQLKRSVFLTARDFPYEIGFYDVSASPGQRTQHSIAHPDFPPSASGSPEEPGDVCRP